MNWLRIVVQRLNVSEYVLDASAVLAYLQKETGWERVETLLLEHRCYLLTVNLTEVLTRLADWKVPVAEIQSRISGLEMVMVPFDIEHARYAAELRESTRSLGLSLGDRACLALAKLKALPAVTADRPWMLLDAKLEISVECIRPEKH
jgi:ribonuclease VapC